MNYAARVVFRASSTPNLGPRSPSYRPLDHTSLGRSQTPMSAFEVKSDIPYPYPRAQVRK